MCVYNFKMKNCNGLINAHYDVLLFLFYGFIYHHCVMLLAEILQTLLPFVSIFHRFQQVL